MLTLKAIDRRVKYRSSYSLQRGHIGVGHQQRRDEAALRISPGAYAQRALTNIYAQRALTNI